MKTILRSIVVCAIISLSLFAGKANAGIIAAPIDSVCCNPDSLKVVSVNYPVFCVSWRISSDSMCKTPYGFAVQWRLLFPATGAWTERIKIYTGGTLINFCDTLTNCGVYQWRVRAICDTTGDSTYSDWVYGNKFSTNCDGGVGKTYNGLKKAPGASTNIANLSTQIRKPEEEKEL